MKRHLPLIITITVIGILLVAASVEARQYQIERLGSLGGGYARARSVSNSGQIVGEALIPVQGSIEHAFTWKDGQINDLGTLGGAKSRAMDINDDGVVAGWALNADGATKPVLWRDGSIEELPTLGGATGVAWGVNDLGHAVGNSFISPSVYHATIWADGGATDLGTLGGSYSVAYDINSNGVVVGGADNAAGKQRACLWTEGTRVDLGSISGGSWDTARGINDNGQVILWGIPAGAAENHAVLWNGGAADPVIDLGTFGGGESWAYGMNNLGNVVGWAEFSSGIYHAFSYDGLRMNDLGTLGGMFSSAYGVNNDGIVVGYAQDATNSWYAARWVPVPEPSGLCALTAGLGCLASILRRRRRQRQPARLLADQYNLDDVRRK